MASYNTQALGKLAEQAACEYLQTKGMRLLTQNYRAAAGEIDLIMQDKEDIVFVEVRSRSRTDYGSAAETINQIKKRKLIKTAMHYLQIKNCLYKVHSRFDVVAIHHHGDTMQIDWIKNAFLTEY